MTDKNVTRKGKICLSYNGVKIKAKISIFYENIAKTHKKARKTTEKRTTLFYRDGKQKKSLINEIFCLFMIEFLRKSSIMIGA